MSGRTASAARRPTTPAPRRLGPFGLADAVGLVAAGAVVTVVPGVGAPATSMREAVLVVGAAAVAPYAGARLLGTRPRGAGGVGLVAAAVMAVLSVVSLLASPAPWVESLNGWYGRGTGVLAILAAAVLLSAATMLRGEEPLRLLSWVVGAATACAVVSLVQAVGVPLLRTVDTSGAAGTMGNPNFAAGVMAVALPVSGALTVRAWRSAPRRGSLVGTWTASATLLAIAIVATASTQGPVAAGVGALTSVLVWAAASPRRRLTRYVGVAAGAVLGLVVVVLALSAAGRGPAAALWATPSAAVRRVWWDTAVRIASSHPWTGIGPDSFARGVGEARTETYLHWRGSDHYVSAAHDILLQWAATLGVPAAVAWIVVVGAAATALVLVVARRSADPLLVAATAGALVAYLTQGSVSIDVVGLLAVGWVVIGLALGSAGWPRGARPTPAVPLAWLSPLAAALLVVPGLVGTVQARGSTPSAATATSSLTPCVLRAALLRDLMLTGATGAVDAARTSFADDPRCPDVASVVALGLVDEGRPADARDVTRAALDSDPLSAQTWVARAAAFRALNDTADASAAAAEAARLARLSPKADRQRIERLLHDLLGAGR